MKEVMDSLKRWSVVFVAVGMAVATTGCGKSSPFSNIVSQMQLKSYQQNGDLWVEMDTSLNTNGFILAGFTAPIVDPHNPNVQYGMISINSNLCPTGQLCTNGGQLTVALDMTQVAHVQTLDSTLPNGTPIPVGGLQNAAVISLPIGQTGARIYIGLGQGVALLGVAMPFKALDGVGSYVPGVDIFVPIQATPINGIVGMFFGSSTNTTGLAMFVDLSGVINKPQSTTSNLASVSDFRMNVMSDETASLISSVTSDPSNLIMQPVKPDSWTEQMTYYELYRASVKHPQLQVR